MRVVFADTGFWIAILNPRDELHDRARLQAAPLGPAQIMTTEMVLAELLNDFATRGPSLRDAAVALVAGLQRNKQMTIVPQTAEQFAATLELYAGRRDKNWSLTDCASFLAMKSHGCTDALTHDRHFEQFGVHAMLRSP